MNLCRRPIAVRPAVKHRQPTRLSSFAADCLVVDALSVCHASLLRPQSSSLDKHYDPGNMQRVDRRRQHECLRHSLAESNSGNSCFGAATTRILGPDRPRCQLTHPQGGGWRILISEVTESTPALPDSPRPVSAIGTTTVTDEQQETAAFRSRSSQFGGPTTVQNSCRHRLSAQDSSRLDAVRHTMMLHQRTRVQLNKTQDRLVSKLLNRNKKVDMSLTRWLMKMCASCVLFQ